MWKFANIKALAVRKLDKLEIPPVEKAVMAREYDIDPAYRWLEYAYAALGVREEPITKEEGVRLGLEAVVSLVELRERIRRRGYERQRNSREKVSANNRSSFYVNLADGALK